MSVVETKLVELESQFKKNSELISELTQKLNGLNSEQLKIQGAYDALKQLDLSEDKKKTK